MRLPIGIQTFKKIREGDYIYVDKTKEAYELITNYEYAFLSRPRRFGKSLFLDTLRNIFEGNKELFKGLYIYDKWEFEEYPVIKIDWAGDFKTLDSTKNVAREILKENQRRLGIVCENDAADMCFRELIQKTYEKYQKRVVVLIDEYDKPILDNIENPIRAIDNRDFLRSFYVQLKANDEYIKFAFLTGISKFSKASIFSGLNNLVDISLMPKFGNICGYTHQNLQKEFCEYSKNFDLEKIREWYNGYCFLKDRIYNPFDILRLFDEGRFKNYWWQSGNPYFLIQMLKKKRYYIPELENLVVGEELINTFEIEDLKLEVLLYQAGYLTIKSMQERRTIEYTLTVPNLEVQMSLNNLFIDYLTNHEREKYRYQDSLYEALVQGDLESFKNHLESLFASIAYNNYVKNEIATYEGYYASVVYAYLASLGFKMVAEDVTNKGRIDLTLFVDDTIYIIEFKVGKEDALSQLRKKNYHKKYLNKAKMIYLIGINFEERSITRMEWERIENDKIDDAY